MLITGRLWKRFVTELLAFHENKARFGQTVTLWAAYAYDGDTWEGSPVWDYPQQEFTFTWDFGDGTHTSGNGPIMHSWSSSGVKIVTLGVHDPGNIWDDAVASVTASVTVSAITSVTGPTHPLCLGEVGYFSAILDPPGADYHVNWTGGGSPPTAEHTSAFGTGWFTPGLKTVTATCKCSSDSASVQVMEPLHEITFLEQNGTGGWINVRMKVRTRCADFFGQNDLFDFSMHEEGAPHPADWELLFPNLVQESYSYDENTLIEEVVYIVEIDTLALHNSTYTLRVDSDAYECPDYQTIVHHQVDKSLTICNLVVSASPEVLIWDGETEPTLQIHLEDGVPDNTTVDLFIYDSDQILVRTIPLTLSIGTHSYTWDGKDTNGNTLESGVYIYRLTASQEIQGDYDSDTSGAVQSTDLSVPDECPETGLPMVNELSSKGV